MNARILTLCLGDNCIAIRYPSFEKKWHDLGSLAVIPEGAVWKFFWTPNSTGPMPESDPSHFQIAGIFCTNPGLPWGHGHKPKINGESGTRQKRVWRQGLQQDGYRFDTTLFLVTQLLVQPQFKIWGKKWFDLRQLRHYNSCTNLDM